jgi:hypothetical protein
MPNTDIRHDWGADEVRALYDQPVNDLLFRAQSLHWRYCDPNRVQPSTLLSIKTGAAGAAAGWTPQAPPGFIQPRNLRIGGWLWYHGRHCSSPPVRLSSSLRLRPYEQPFH